MTVASIGRVLDLDNMSSVEGETVPPDGFAEITLTASHAILFDPFSPGLSDGRGVLVDRHQRIVGGAPLIGVAELKAGRHVLHPTVSQVPPHQRRDAVGHDGKVFWLTGLPGSGKSTLARKAEVALTARGLRVTVLDGDTLRAGLCSDLGFSPEDRRENIRRAAHVARILAEAGQIVIVALVSPRATDRALARDLVGAAFDEIYIDADVALCEARDPKGLYAAARAGQLKDFTGVSAPYDPPVGPALRLAAEEPLEANLAAFQAHILNAERSIA